MHSYTFWNELEINYTWYHIERCHLFIKFVAYIHIRWLPNGMHSISLHPRTHAIFLGGGSGGGVGVHSRCIIRPGHASYCYNGALMSRDNANAQMWRRNYCAKQQQNARYVYKFFTTYLNYLWLVNITDPRLGMNVTVYYDSCLNIANLFDRTPSSWGISRRNFWCGSDSTRFIHNIPTLHILSATGSWLTRIHQEW